jgi:flagellar motor protein MotB
MTERNQALLLPMNRLANIPAYAEIRSCARELSMRNLVLAGGCAMLALIAGCAENPYMLQRQVQAEQQQRLAVTQQATELQKQIDVLDKDNQELQTMLAQSRQQSQVMQEQLAAMRDQLSGATGQVARLQDEYQATEKRAEALAASTRRRAGASITANNSLAQTLPTFTQPGVQARRDGDVIRIELPADALFEPNAAQLRTGAGRMIEEVADELARSYPGHFIGIEGHADADPAQQAAASSNHQLSVTRATAVFEQLSTRTRLRADQMFVAGHGGNHPVVSNATPAGRERNRRIELVVYPERVAGR